MKLIRVACALVMLVLASGCSKSLAVGLEGWIRTRPEITLDRMEELPASSFGESSSWKAYVTAKPGVTPEQLSKVIEAWPKAPKDRRTVMQLTAPQFTFAADYATDSTKERWDALLTVLRGLPDAHVDASNTGGFRVNAGECDAWSKIQQFDAATVINVPKLSSLQVDCRGAVNSTLSMTKAGWPQVSDPSVRSRVERTLGQIPGHTGWFLQLSGPQQSLSLTVDAPQIPLTPTHAELLRDSLSLTVKNDRVRARASNYGDYRAPAIAAAEVAAVRQVDTTYNWIEMKGDASRLAELKPVVARFPNQTWMLTDQGLLLRTTSDQFDERVRQLESIRATGVDVGQITMIEVPSTNRPMIAVKPPVGADLIEVSRALRSARWQGEMTVEIGSASPHVRGAEFRSTATGKAVGARQPNAPGSKTDNPESAERVAAWDATAS